MNREYFGAIDIGGTKITVSIADKERFLTKYYQKAKKEGDNTTLPLQIKNLMMKAAKDSDISTKDIKSIGISSCGPFSKHNGYLTLVAPNLCGGLSSQSKDSIKNDWTYIPIEEVLSRDYENITVYNDCISAAIAEHKFGAGKEFNNMAYVTWSTGIGAGVIEKDKPVLGKNNNASHLGHVPIMQGGRECGCGSYGHLEAMTAGPAIEQIYSEKIGEKTSVIDVFKRYSHDNTAREVIDNAAKYFTQGLEILNNMHDLEAIILGGSVMKDHDILMPLIKPEFKNTFKALSQDTQIKLTGLKDYLGDMAALSIIMPDDMQFYWINAEPWKYAPETIKIE